MPAIHDSRHRIAADIQSVWALLTEPPWRQHWMPGVHSAEPISGESGLRGAVMRLSMADGEHTVDLRCRRARRPERLQWSFEVGNCQYSQLIWLVRTEHEHTELHYHAKRELRRAWRKLLPISPGLHPLADPAQFEALAQFVEARPEAVARAAVNAVG